MEDVSRHLSSTSRRVVEFWSWFMNWACEMDTSEVARKMLLEQLSDKLRQVDERLSYEVCLNCMPREFVLTVNGRVDLFDLADRMVAVAPPIDGWAIIALKPAAGFSFRTTYEGIEYDPKTMWFLPLTSESNPGAIGIRVGIPDYDPSRERQARNVVDIILRTGLGERSAAVDVQHVEVGSLPVKLAEEGFIELPELAGYIKWKKRPK